MRFVTAAVAAAAAILVAQATPASAAPILTLTLSDGTDTVTKTINLNNKDTVTIDTAVGTDYTTTFTIGTGSDGTGFLSLTSEDVAAAASPGALTIELTATNQDLGKDTSQNVLFSATSSINSAKNSQGISTASPAGSAVVSAYYDPNDGADPASTGVSLGSVALNAVGDGANIVSPEALSGKFSTSELAVLTFTSPGTLGFTASVTPIPEPASLALVGAGLFGMGLIRRRKHTGNKQPR